MSELRGDQDAAKSEDDDNHEPRIYYHDTCTTSTPTPTSTIAPDLSSTTSSTLVVTCRAVVDGSGSCSPRAFSIGCWPQHPDVLSRLCQLGR